MTTARDLLTAAGAETGWCRPTVNAIAATPSGAELLRRADEADRLRGALEKALECIRDAERELHVWVDRDRVRHPGWPDVGYEPWNNKPSLALWSVEVDEVERMARAALATPATDVLGNLTSSDQAVIDDLTEEVGRLRDDLDAALATPATDDPEPDPTALLG